MDPAILSVHFPEGDLPAKGFRCRICGSERVLDLPMIQQLARKLGLYGLEHASKRKLQRTGTSSITVTLDPDLLKEVVPNAKPGTTVTVGRQGDAIVIRAA